MEIIHVEEFSFYSNFDSSNLRKVEQATISYSGESRCINHNKHPNI